MPDFYSIQDVLSFAIHLEQASQEFYRHLSRTIASPSVARFLAELAKEEKLHEQRLTQLLTKAGGIAQQQISSDQIDCYIQAIKVSDSLDYKDAVKLAMDKEKAAQMLYSVSAGVMEDPILADVFRQLSAQEKNHRQFFESQYQQICI
ncbi:MAG: ferritin family protein, partial [Planctomycetota bacterium]